MFPKLFKIYRIFCTWKTWLNVFRIENMFYFRTGFFFSFVSNFITCLDLIRKEHGGGRSHELFSKSLNLFILFEIYDAVFYRAYPLLYHKFYNMVIFRWGNLYSVCSPGNQDYQRTIYFFNFISKKVEIGLIISWFINYN